MATGTQKIDDPLQQTRRAAERDSETAQLGSSDALVRTPGQESLPPTSGLPSPLSTDGDMLPSAEHPSMLQAYSSSTLAQAPSAHVDDNNSYFPSISNNVEAVHPWAPQPRGVSSPTGQVMSPTHLPGHGHVHFANITPVQDTPFEKTMNYFKRFQEIQKTRSKARRNASLPDEIAQLAEEAQQEGTEDDKALWDKYREIDLAPMDPVLSEEIIGDLNIATPSSKAVVSNGEYPGSPDRPRASNVRPRRHSIREDAMDSEEITASSSLDEKVIEGSLNETGPMYLVDIPGHFDDKFSLRFRTSASADLIASFLQERGRALEANQDDINHLVEVFLRSPSDFIISDGSNGDPITMGTGCSLHEKHNERASESGPVSSCNKHGYRIADGHVYEKQIVLSQEPPVFVKVVELLPGAMLSVAVLAVTNGCRKALVATSKALNIIQGKVTGLPLDNAPASQ